MSAMAGLGGIGRGRRPSRVCAMRLQELANGTGQLWIARPVFLEHGILLARHESDDPLEEGLHPRDVGMVVGVHQLPPGT